MVSVFSSDPGKAPGAFEVSISELIDGAGFSITSGSVSIDGAWCSSV